jgi:hypothetical protein
LPAHPAALEAELPEELQDWSQFEVKGQELKLKKCDVSPVEQGRGSLLTPLGLHRIEATN